MNRRSAFTLIEMVTSLVILSVLLMACGSIIRMATRLTGDAAARTAVQLQAADAAGRVVDDLNVAIAFTQRTSRAVTFTVPDRLSAGSPQTVSYSWSGTAGDPLLRTFNGGTATGVLAGVQNLSFGFATRTVGVAPPTEQASFDHSATSGTLKDFAVTNLKFAAQAFTPSLPYGTASYSITRVRIMLKTGTVDSVLKLSLCAANAAGQPTTTVLAQTNVYVSALSTAYEWVDVPISGVSGLDPYQSVCVVLGYASGSNAVASVQYDQVLISILSTAYWTTSTNAGATWSSASAVSTAKMTVYGTVP